MIAIVGGLGAAVLWAIATLASSRSSRMIGSRVVLAWVMIVGTIGGLPLGLLGGVPADFPPGAPVLLLLAGLCYAGGLYSAYTALTFGKVSIVAPIVATEGAVAALIAVALGDTLASGAAIVLTIIVIGVVLSSIEPARPDVPAGDIEIAADALEGPPIEPGQASREHAGDDIRKAVTFSTMAAVIFGVGLVAAGKAAVDVPPIWVAVTIRLVGLVVVALPLVLQRRLVLSREALPLVVIAGIGEILGSTLSAWGLAINIPITVVLGSQFAAIAAVVAFLLFGERLARSQVVGVVLIVAGVTALAATGI